MKTIIDWPDVDSRGLIQVSLTRANLVMLLAGLDARHTGTPGIVSVDGDLVVVVTVAEAE